LFVCIGFFLNRRALRKITRIIDVHDELGLEEDTDPRVFVTARGVKSEHSKYPYEYISAVYELGLSADASMKEIKAAYRSKMKGIHPDAVQSQQRDTGEFIHVKQVYERIIALRKELGLDL
jgi:DnaJ-domain-containing protein 1